MASSTAAAGWSEIRPMTSPARSTPYRWRSSQGPCLDTTHEQHTVRADNLTTGQRWRLFAARAAETAAASMLASQLYVERRHHRRPQPVPPGPEGVHRRLQPACCRGACRYRLRQGPVTRETCLRPGRPRPERAGEAHSDGALPHHRRPGILALDPGEPEHQPQTPRTRRRTDRVRGDRRRPRITTDTAIVRSGSGRSGGSWFEPSDLAQPGPRRLGRVSVGSSPRRTWHYSAAR